MGGPFLSQFIIYNIILLVYNYLLKVETWSQSSQSTQLQSQFPRLFKSIVLCSLEVESISHFYLHCHYYSNIRSTLLNELQSIDINLSNQEDDIVVEVILYESTKFNNNQNFGLLSSSIDYILKSKRFSGSLLQHGESIFKCALSYFYLEV